MEGVPLLDELPAALQSVKAAPLFVMRLVVKPMVMVGETPGPTRRIGIVTSGRFAGDRISGEVLDGGSDWQDLRSDGSVSLDVRLILRTDDGVAIPMSYRGVRHGPQDVIRQLEQGQGVDPGAYYFRTNPIFEAPIGKYEWLNGIVAIGIGHRFSYGPMYSVFEVL